MRAPLKWLYAAGIGLGLAAASPVWASSHREAPAIANDPAADNTDVWAWVNPGSHDSLYVVAAWNPLEEPSGGPNFHKFSDDVLYQIHITRGAKSLCDVVTYRIRFHTTPIQFVNPADLTKPPGGGKEFFSQLSGQTQTYTLSKVLRRPPGNDGHCEEEHDNVDSKPLGPDGPPHDEIVLARDVPVAPVRIGPRTQAVLGLPTYDDAFAASFIKDMGNEGRIWAGPRDDGFYVDLGGIFDLANLRAKGTAQDGVAGYNCHAIAIEIPTRLLTENGGSPGNTPGNATTLGVWASASRPEMTILHDDESAAETHGHYVQVSRLGLPLINEAVIGLQDKDKYNRTHPSHDVQNFGAYFLNPIVVRDAEAVGIYAALGVDPTPFKSNRTDIIDIINLTNFPTPGAHSIPLSSTGDVLRVDMAANPSFPNGRSIPGGAGPNQEQADVTDVLLSVLLSKGLVAIKDNVDYNDKNYLTSFPWLALPWQGFDQGHGKPTP